jgi:hypothetical protein
MGVMLSVAKHLAFSVTHEDEILRLLPHQDDVATQSVAGGFQTRPYTLFAVAPYGRPVLRQAQHPEPSRGTGRPVSLLTLCYLPSTIWLYALCSLLFALLLQLCEKSLPLQFCNDAVIHEFGRLLVSE